MGSDVQVRSFLESLTTLQYVSSESGVKVQVTADVVDQVEFKGAKTRLTLSWCTNSRKIQVQGLMGMLDHARRQVAQLMKVYYDYGETGQIKLPSRGSERAASMLRRPPWSEFLPGKEARAAEYEPKPLCVHGDVEFATVMGQVTQRGALLGKWPEWQGPFGAGDGSGILSS